MSAHSHWAAGGPDPEAHPGVHEILGEDHRRLDALLDGVVAFARSGPETSRNKVRLSFCEFATGLRRHIRAEEELLFPAFEAFTGIHGGPVVVMRREHREIERLLDEIAAALQESEPAEGLVDKLRDFLVPHNLKEEQVLYPMTDSAMDHEARAELVRRIEAAL